MGIYTKYINPVKKKAHSSSPCRAPVAYILYSIHLDTYACHSGQIPAEKTKVVCLNLDKYRYNVTTNYSITLSIGDILGGQLIISPCHYSVGRPQRCNMVGTHCTLRMLLAQGAHVYMLLHSMYTFTMCCKQSLTVILLHCYYNVEFGAARYRAED